MRNDVDLYGYVGLAPPANYGGGETNAFESELESEFEVRRLLRNNEIDLEIN